MESMQGGLASCGLGAWSSRAEGVGVPRFRAQRF